MLTTGEMRHSIGVLIALLVAEINDLYVSEFDQLNDRPSHE
jgi:hypothetical protein